MAMDKLQINGSARGSLSAGVKAELWLWIHGQGWREMRIMETRQHSGTGQGRRRLFNT